MHSSPRHSRLLVLVLLLAAGSAVALMMWVALQPREPSCAQRIHGIGSAIMLYLQEHDGRAPASLDELVELGLLPDDRWLSCPMATGPEGRYVYFRHKVLDPSSPEATRAIMVYEPLANHDAGGHVLFADGATLWLGSSEIEAISTSPEWPTRAVDPLQGAAEDQR